MRLITTAKEGSELFYFYVMPQATEQNVGCKDSGGFANYLSLTYNLQTLLKTYNNCHTCFSTTKKKVSDNVKKFARFFDRKERKAECASINSPM